MPPFWGAARRELRSDDMIGFSTGNRTWRQAGQAAEQRQKIGGYLAQGYGICLQVSLGNNHQPDVRRELFLMQADKFAQNPLNSVTLRGGTAFLGHSRAHLPGDDAMRLKTDENDEIFRKKAFALVIAGGKLRPIAQPVLRPET